MLHSLVGTRTDRTDDTIPACQLDGRQCKMGVFHSDEVGTGRSFLSRAAGFLKNASCIARGTLNAKLLVWVQNSLKKSSFQ